MPLKKVFSKKISVIVTVLNEAETILKLLTSLKNQTYRTNEIIIVDGGSQDNTVQLIKAFADKNLKLNINFFIQKGNRSKGRNYAIKQAKNDLIAITDAGCLPRKKWLEELVKTFNQESPDAVAGYYAGLVMNSFQQAVIPYVLVMPDRVNADHFLPATRSMMMTKLVWGKLNGFDEKLSHNEDYDFAQRLKKNSCKIVFTNRAIVDWLPVGNLLQFYRMIFRFAQGDVEARIFRPKVFLIFFRYLFALVISLFIILNSFVFFLVFLLLVVIVYTAWSISKNLKYTPQGWYWLPVLQVTSDVGVMLGSLRGIQI